MTEFLVDALKAVTLVLRSSGENYELIQGMSKSKAIVVPLVRLFYSTTEKLTEVPHHASACLPPSYQLRPCHTQLLPLPATRVS